MAKGRKTGGRKAGTPNKVTAEIKGLAQMHGEAAIYELVRLMTEARSEMVRVVAIGEILNRGYGKASQHVELTGKVSLVEELKAARERAGIPGG